MYKTQLIKYILDLSVSEKREFAYGVNHNKISHGFYAFIINIANDLIKIAKENTEISNTLESIPEWTAFQEGQLKEKNDVLVGPLGGRDPRAKIDSLFDDNDFLGRFKGFKPVPFDSIKSRRKKLENKIDDEVEQETEEEEDEDEENVEIEDINKYFQDNEDNEDDEEVNLEVRDEEKPDFSKTSKKDTLGDIISKSKCKKGRYETIEMDDDEIEMEGEGYEEDDDDDVNQKGLEWNLDPVSRETDDEKLIDDHIADVAMEFIRGQKQRRTHNTLVDSRQHEAKESKREEFDIPIPLILGHADEADKKDEEDKKFYDTEYWRDSYMSNFKIEDLLLE